MARARVVLRPADHAFACIDVGDTRSCCRGRHGGPAGVGKEIQDFHFPVRFRSLPVGNQLREDFPVGRLLREDARVLELEGTEVETDFLFYRRKSVADLPFLRQVKDFPVAPAFG